VFLTRVRAPSSLKLRVDRDTAEATTLVECRGERRDKRDDF
jgi:hypothetical protein